MAGLALVVLTDAPCPRAGITVDGLHVSTTSVITVWRSVAGEDRAAVRGMRKLSVVDATYVVDYEAPLGRPVTYTLEVTGPTIPATLEATVTVASTTVWLQDPLDPSTACEVNFGAGSGPIVLSSSALAVLGYPNPADLVRVMGSKYPTMLGGGGMAAQGVPFDLLTKTIEAANRLRILLGSASPLLLRTVPRISPPLPALAYLSASASERPITAFIGGSLTKWELTGDLVTGPSINVLVAAWTYAQVSALYDTYATAAARGGTYLSWMKDPRP